MENWLGPNALCKLTFLDYKDIRFLISNINFNSFFHISDMSCLKFYYLKCCQLGLLYFEKKYAH